MALLLPKSIFFHIPKTGGTWVRTALRRAGLASRETNAPHCIPVHIKNLMEDRFAFAFVRHPLWWYRSYWCFKMTNGWHMPEAKGDYFAMDWKAWTFENFLKNVIERTPGYLSSLYELYIDNPPINFVGKTEYLTDDLVKALQTAGETFDEYKLRSTPMMNTSIMRAEYPKDLELKIRELEKRAFERFGYE